MKVVLATGVAGLMSASMLSAPAMSHHSFAMYTDAIAFTFVGVMSSVNPDANHQTIDFAVINAARNNYVYQQVVDPTTGATSDRLDPSGNRIPVTMRVEMGGASGAANAGVTAARFSAGTVISTVMNPLRSMLPPDLGIQGGVEGGALVAGRGGGDGIGGNASLSICPVNAETGRFVLPPAGMFCDQLEGYLDFSNNAQIADAIAEDGAVEWAVWISNPVITAPAPEPAA
jgi:hypothetical protein